jgi:hypothetical protein
MYFGPHLVDWLVQAAQRWIDWREIDAVLLQDGRTRVHLRPPETAPARHYATGYFCAAVCKVMFVEHTAEMLRHGEALSGQLSAIGLRQRFLDKLGMTAMGG